jgi:hypothetical protein
MVIRCFNALNLNNTPAVSVDCNRHGRPQSRNGPGCGQF